MSLGRNVKAVPCVRLKISVAIGRFISLHVHVLLIEASCQNPAVEGESLVRYPCRIPLSVQSMLPPVTRSSALTEILPLKIKILSFTLPRVSPDASEQH